MSLDNETYFAMTVHRLFLVLQASGIGLVKLPPPYSVEKMDIISALAEGVEHFSQTMELSDSGRHLLHNYLSDHLYEQGKDGFERLVIDKDHFTRASSDA